MIAFASTLKLTQAFVWLTQPRMQLQFSSNAHSVSVTRLLMATLLIDLMFAGARSDIACHIGGFVFGYAYVTTQPHTIAACWSLVDRDLSRRIFRFGFDQRSAFMFAAAMAYAMVVTILCVVAGDGTHDKPVRWETGSRMRQRRRVVNGILK